MGMLRKVLGVGSGVVALMCFAVAAVGIAEVIAGVPDPGTWGALVFTLGLGGGASVGAYRGLRAAPSQAALPAVDPTQMILALAAREGGHVTAIEVAAKTSLTLAQAQAALDGLAGQNLVSSIVTEDGVELYRVKGLLAIDEKREARDILDE
jgi:hypothetical protein